MALISQRLTLLIVGLSIFLEGLGEIVKIGIINDNKIVDKKKIEEEFEKIVEQYGQQPDPKRIIAHPSEIDKPAGLMKFSKVKCILDFSMSKELASKLGETLRIPVVTVEPNVGPIGYYVVSMYPDYERISGALVQTLKEYKMNPVALVYDEKRSQQAANLQSIARMDGVRMILMPEIRMDHKRSLAYAAGELKRSHLTSGVLLCDPREIYKILRETLTFKLYEEHDWQWFAPDLDYKINCTSTLNGLVGFNRSTPKNIKGRRELFMKNVLRPHGKVTNQLSDNHFGSMHDAMQLVMRALRNRTRNCDGCFLNTLKNTYVPACHGPEDERCSWTGKVELINGTRRPDTMNIVAINNRRNGGVEAVGEWSPGKGALFRANSKKWVTKHNQDCMNERSAMKEKKKYKILVKPHDEPFVFINDNKSLPAEERFTGFSIDIVRELAKEKYMNFNYTIEIVDGTGKWQVSTSRWSGIIGKLIDQKADMGTGSLTITAGREKAIDFSKPFMDFHMALILQKPEEEKQNMFRFLDPFSPMVWLCTVLAVFAQTIFMYIVDYLSPYGYRKTAMESGEPGNEFSLYNSLWFATASMLQQGGDNTPKSPSGRLLAASFWFFVLLMISTYTANLAAFFTNKKPKQTINSLEDLTKQNKIKYGVLKNGQIHSFLEQSNDTAHKKMVAQMTSQDTFVGSASDGVTLARKGGFAYLTETPILEYFNSQKPCNTILVRNLLETKSYGFALPKNSELTTNLSVNILQLRENGFMDDRYTYWWKTMSECETKPKPKGLDSMKIQLNNMAGVFIVLVAGAIISFILLIVEVKFKWLVDLILEAGCEQCTDYYCEDEESYEYMEPVDATSPSSLKRVPDAYMNAQESKV